MPAAPLPADEEARLAELHRSSILDTEADPAFDRVTRLAAAMFGTPIALVSFVDENRQWFKSCVGVEITESPRETSFCAHALDRSEVLVIQDATADPRFADNALVTGETHIRFYAGAPLRTRNGLALGTLCILDTEPHADEFGPEQQQHLADLAAIVIDELELRSAAGALVEARNAAEQANDAKSQMLSFISHEMGGPLTTIYGFSDLLERVDLDEGPRDMVVSIRRAAEHLHAVVQDLLDIARLEKGELRLDLDDVDLGVLAAEVVADAGPHADSLGISVTADLDGSSVVAAGDPVRLRQVVSNLVSNATKYNRPGGSVTVATALDDGAATITVADTGIGISAAEIDTMFDAFVRLESGKDRKGVGLGLALVRQLVERMGGTISVTSTVGEGSRFEVSLPAA